MHDRDDPTDNWKIAKRKEIRGKILVFGEEKKKADEKKNGRVVIVRKHGMTFDKLYVQYYLR